VQFERAQQLVVAYALVADDVDVADARELPFGDVEKHVDQVAADLLDPRIDADAIATARKVLLGE
jgi:hypothetical protein